MLASMYLSATYITEQYLFMALLLEYMYRGPSNPCNTEDAHYLDTAPTLGASIR